MTNFPNDCTVCPYENSCNSAMALPGCHFFYARNQKYQSKNLIKNVKKLFGKLFK